MPAPLDWIQEELKSLQNNNLLRRRTTRESPPVAGIVQIDGRQFINFGSNDYLGIASHQELVLAVQDSVSQLGVGAGASQLVNGRGTIHRRLEQEIAIFEGTASALLFPTGYAANIGVITSLVGKGDVVFSDSLNHASIIDGCRLSGAKIVVYPHSDVEKLAELMQDSSGDDRGRKLIVTDGLFSMDGDFARLPELCALAGQHDAMIVVDEAHATGIYGANGRGSCEMLDVENQVTAKIGTLSKAAGCIGGFVAGDQSLIDLVYNRARSQIYSTALPEITCAAAIAALKIFKQEPERRKKLLSLSKQVRSRLKELGFDLGSCQSQIIPLIVGTSAKALKWTQKLAEAGIYAPAIRFPSVLEHQARLRISLSSEHRDDHIDLLHKFIAKQ